MPSLISTLANYDLDFLTRIARRWGAQISQRDVNSARADLAARMMDAAAFAEIRDSLDAAAGKAWVNLVQKGGKIPWAEFSRSYGEIRDFGPASRQREEPDLHPISASEALWYAGLAGRAFLKSDQEPQEYFYVPDELLAFVKISDQPSQPTLLRPAINQKPKYILRAERLLPDRVTDVLAALRMKRELSDEVWEVWQFPRGFAYPLLRAAGLVDGMMQPIPEALKEFFAASRGQVHALLYQAWRSSTEINELRMLPGLIFEGTWQNDPLAPRRLLIDLLTNLNAGTWWSLSSLITTVKETTPDFQRQGGDYDSWYIRETGSSIYLSGFENWERVEGALLTFLLCGPLHWLGVVNLAKAGADGKITAFQLDEAMKPLLEVPNLVASDAETREIKIRDALRFSIPSFAPRLLRYQVARFCELVSVFPKESLYVLTTASLSRAEEQGLQLSQLLQLLEKENAAAIPESLRSLEERWSLYGQEATIRKALLLRFTREAACAEFIKRAAGRFDLEVLNPLNIVITERQLEGIVKLLSELGILADIEGMYNQNY